MFYQHWIFSLKDRNKDIFKVNEFGENISYPGTKFHTVHNSTMAFRGITSLHILSEATVVEIGKQKKILKGSVTSQYIWMSLTHFWKARNSNDSFGHTIFQWHHAGKANQFPLQKWTMSENKSSFSSKGLINSCLCNIIPSLTDQDHSVVGDILGFTDNPDCRHDQMLPVK